MTDDTQDTARFVIDGDEYDVPSLYSFDMDENKIMYDMSGMATEDWLMMIQSAQAPGTTSEEYEDLAAKIRNPGFLRAYVHIAYRRAHPDTDFAGVELVVGKASQIANWVALFLNAPGEETADPTLPASTAKDEESSVSEQQKPLSVKSWQTLGTSSETGSDPQDGVLVPTGTSGSDTSSLASDPQRLAS